jgi:hypothetical protein
MLISEKERTPMMIDLHIHESTFSPCSKMRLPEIVQAARERGLDAVCITDHDSMGLWDEAHAYSHACGFPIFVGVEVFTLEGDIVTFGLPAAPAVRPTAQDLITQVERKGGFCFSAHPFRENQRGLGEVLRQLKGVFGVEVLNGNTDLANNQKALRYCKELGFLPVACSDAHHAHEVGKYATWFPDAVKSESDLIGQLRSGRCRPMQWQEGQYIPADEF